MQEYAVTLVNTVSSPFSHCVVSDEIPMSYREIRQHLGELQRLGFTESVSGAGHDWDPVHERYLHFRYVLSRSSGNCRQTHSMFIRCLDDTCYCETCTDRAVYASLDR